MAEQYDDRFARKYSEYNSVLRTWFVAFGVGVPGALLLNLDTKAALSASSSATLVISFLLGGTVFQIFIAFLNKYIAWANDLILHNDSSDEPDASIPGPFIKALADLTEKVWIDLVIDIVTGILFVVALINLYRILT